MEKVLEEFDVLLYIKTVCIRILMMTKARIF